MGEKFRIMSERYKLVPNQRKCWDIVDMESDILTIYNDLGHYYFSSAPAICTLLNDYEDKLKSKDELIDELYKFRLIYNAALFNEWVKYDYMKVYKSRRHYDGGIPFEDDDEEWFIVVAILPNGKQITNHYQLKYWDLFKIPEYSRVRHEFDNHTSEDVIFRLMEFINGFYNVNVKLD